MKVTRRQLRKLILESVPSIFKNTLGGIEPPDPDSLRLLNREFAHQNLEIGKRREIKS